MSNDRKNGEKIVHIVYDKYSGKVAKLMQKIIIKKNNIKCEIFKSDVYYGSPYINTDCIRIFLGDIESIELFRTLVENERKYEKWGWHYGWLKRFAFVWDKYVLMVVEDKKKFLTDYKMELKEVMKKVNALKGKEPPFEFDLSTSIAFNLLGFAVKKSDTYLLRKAPMIILKHYAFKLAAMKFINNGLDEFIENGWK